jgi:hypothetical protein
MTSLVFARFLKRSESSETLRQMRKEIEKLCEKVGL